MPARTDLTISKRTVDALSVEGREAVFWDRDLPGFGVRVYPSGRKVYVVQSRGPKGPKRVTAGPAWRGPGRAGEKEGGARSSTASSRERTPFPPPPEPELTMAGLAGRYMEAHVSANCNAHTRGHLPGVARQPHPPGAGSDAGQLSRTFGGVGAALRGSRHTPRAANRALMVLSKMFSLAEAWGLAPAGSNPCRSVGQVQGRKARGGF